MPATSLPGQILVPGLICFLLLLSTARAEQKTSTLSWAEGNAGCTFAAGDDGKYRYGLWTDEFGVVVAVDAQELEKSRRRPEPFLALFLNVRYRGKDRLELDAGTITLQFSSHYKETENPMPPDKLSAALEKDASAAAQSAAKEIQKHPEKEAALRSSLELRRRDIADMQQFLKDHALGKTRLSSEHPEASGWIYFSARGRWIGDWKKQEQFVLKVPVGVTVVEFPFLLPPSQGDFRLRARPESQ
jgi:hypothetical protein